MTVRERIDANANLVKWCVHVLGPDDVMAAPSYTAAVIRAQDLNVALHGKDDRPSDVLCFAVAAPWPHDHASHAESLRDWLKQQ